MSGSTTTPRFAAMLLFQYRVVVQGRSNRRRTVERRLIHVQASSARTALNKARKYGIKEQYDFVNAAGQPVHYEFVGVLDLLELGLECDAVTVWYDIGTMVSPSERRATLIPRDEDLSAICTIDRSRPRTPRPAHPQP